MRQLYPDMARDNSVIEVPVLKWTDVPGSKMTFRHITRSLIDILRIYRVYRKSR
jgi:hypothetical protein